MRSKLPIVDVSVPLFTVVVGPVMEKIGTSVRFCLNDMFIVMEDINCK